MSSGGAFVIAKQLKNGKWRLYEIEQQALLQWRGPNYKATVIRDVDGSIATFNGLISARQYALEVLREDADEAPFCETCGRYLGLAEGNHLGHHNRPALATLKRELAHINPTFHASKAG